MTPLNVLVVDDEPLARRRVARLLRALPWVGAIEEAAHVPQALERLDRFDAHILLLDIQMPGGSGFDLLACLQSQPAPPVAVFITAFDDQALPRPSTPAPPTTSPSPSSRGASNSRWSAPARP